MAEVWVCLTLPGVPSRRRDKTLGISHIQVSVHCTTNRVPGPGGQKENRKRNYGNYTWGRRFTLVPFASWWSGLTYWNAHLLCNKADGRRQQLTTTHLSHP